MFIYRHPKVAIERETGQVYVGQCGQNKTLTQKRKIGCPQASCGQCSHVAAVLFLLEEMKFKAPTIDKSCTSKERQWGKCFCTFSRHLF